MTYRTLGEGETSDGLEAAEQFARARAAAARVTSPTAMADRAEEPVGPELPPVKPRLF